MAGEVTGCETASPIHMGGVLILLVCAGARAHTHTHPLHFMAQLMAWKKLASCSPAVT